MVYSNMLSVLQTDIPLAKEKTPLYHDGMNHQNAPTAAVLPAPSKEELRRQIQKQRKALAPELRHKWSCAASEHIIRSTAWQNARTVALTVSLPFEIATDILLQSAWDTGKTVLLPLCSKTEPGVMPLCSKTEPGVMQFIACRGLDTLVPGPFGILEPAAPEPIEPESAAVGRAVIGAVTSDSTALQTNAPDVVIVPGVAFSLSGARLGMGGGYYDRFFSQPAYHQCTRIGFGYALQVLPDIPQEPWDIPMHALCTEKELIWIPQT